MSTMELVIVCVIGVINLIAFIAQWWDKRAAIRGRRRTPEARLHLWELLGGWPGSLLAMILFRHKIRKFSYLLVFGLIAALWLVVIIWWASVPGA